VIISTHKINMDLENVQKNDQFNRSIKVCFENSIRKEEKLRTHNVIEKPALQYDSEPWILKEERKKRI
jgi:hypothetical protein